MVTHFCCLSHWWLQMCKDYYRFLPPNGFPYSHISGRNLSIQISGIFDANLLIHLTIHNKYPMMKMNIDLLKQLWSYFFMYLSTAKAHVLQHYKSSHQTCWALVIAIVYASNPNFHRSGALGSSKTTSIQKKNQRPQWMFFASASLCWKLSQCGSCQRLRINLGQESQQSWWSWI